MLDLMISGGVVVDGTGAPPTAENVGVTGDRVTWIGPVREQEAVARRRFEASGKIVAPGFIDVHNHSDLVPFVEPWMDSAVRMGCTTMVVGNCGASPWPPSGEAELEVLTGIAGGSLPRWRSFGEYLDAIDDARPAVNVAALVGHGALRQEAMGSARRSPTPDELSSMRRMAGEAIEDGALGISTGLIYPPGMYAETGEIVAVSAEAARRGGVYASHIRGEGEHLFRAIDEAIEIGRRGELPAHVSHLKCETSLQWGRADDALARLRAAGVSADQYPYAAWASSLSSLLPPWAPVEELTSWLASDRDRLVLAVEWGEPTFQSSVKGVGWGRIVIESSRDVDAIGRSVADIARDRRSAPVDAFFDLLREDSDATCIGHAMHEDDVRTILADQDVFVASDASAMSPEGPLGGFPVHPRNYGTFPRVLGRYVRDERLIPVEVAVRKMTSLPADRFGLSGRGRIAEGGYADLVVFDPGTVGDRSDFGAPHEYPAGIELVIVNGRVAWDGRRAERSGRVLRRGA